jgi:Sortase domain
MGAGTGGLDRAASRFGRLAAVLSSAGLAVAVGITASAAMFTAEPEDETDLRVEVAAPVRLMLPSLEVEVPVVEADVPPYDARLVPPDDAPLVSWWPESALVGADTGQTVLTGHSEDAEGALARTDELRVGEGVALVTANGTLLYEVRSVRTMGAQRFARHARGFFDQSGGRGRLVMVSYEDWNETRYARLVVLVAQPVSQ